MDRDAFLTRVGRAAQTSDLPAAPAVPEQLPGEAPDDLIGLFRQRALDVNAVVHGPMGKHGAPRAIAGIAAGHDSRTFVSWDELPSPGVASALTGAGLERIDDRMSNENRLEHQVGYMALDLGVTGSVAGLAESGSVILAHGPGRPRMASLVPEVHVVLVDVADVAWTLSHWAGRNPDAATDTANLVIVTGPSRTGDIEQQLNLGVHGPRHVHIVMIK
ncbi:MAG: LUD domain-containing protein [Actinomycetota bacterium]|nr:LUD domain-containing protein [Actinomycetota bacterium]